MRNYWSCTKFADKIRGVKKPNLFKWGDNSWEEETKKNHPIRYWIAEEFLDKIQDIVLYPRDKINSIRYYIVNRWIDQSYALVAHKDHVNRGRWCDLSDRMFYCLFDELVDFVEIEKASINFTFDNQKAKKFKAPFWSFGLFNTRTFRSPEAGLDYLDWEIGLDEDGTNRQAESAKEIKELYLWYKNVYLNRKSIYDITGWSEYCRNRNFSELGKSTEKSSNILKEVNRLEEERIKEDDEMLIRLIKVRHSLWT